MTRKAIKRTIIGTATAVLFLGFVLILHIYIVTRPQPPGPNTIAMARVDIKTDIDRAAADKITAWVYQQKGIDHVLCNPETNILIFTFYPARTSADAVVAQFKEAFNLDARRYMPSEEEMKKGCPVTGHSVAQVTMKYIKSIF